MINGGTNDISSQRNQINRNLVKMTQFMQKYNNTNIIVVNIPHTYDMDRNSVTNLEIQAFNRTPNKMTKVFSHVAILEIDLHRKYFTQHGMHLNKGLQIWVASRKLLATQICRLVKRNNRDVPVIALNWKGQSIVYRTQ